MKKIIIASVLGVLVLGALIVGIAYISYSNRDARLRVQLSAKASENQVVFDNTWKIIKEQAGVADNYADKFKEIYRTVMEERYSQGGELFKFVTESNPNFDSRLFEKLQNSIEAQRTTFTTKQRELIALKEQHDILLDTFPGTLFLSGREKVEIRLVTSSRTERVFDSGKDDELLIEPKR